MKKKLNLKKLIWPAIWGLIIFVLGRVFLGIILLYYDTGWTVGKTLKVNEISKGGAVMEYEYFVGGQRYVNVATFKSAHSELGVCYLVGYATHARYTARLFFEHPISCDQPDSLLNIYTENPPGVPFFD